MAPALTAALLLAACSQPQKPAEATPALTVTTVAPQRADWPRAVTASGAVAAWQEASIGAQIGSYQLVAVQAEVGDQVRRGQVLARLNPALLRAEEAQLAARDAQTRANHRRALDLKVSGGVSEQDVLAAETEAKAAAALLAAKRLELRYTAITAPDDGVITARAATLGAVVPAGHELFRMIRQGRLEWRGELTAPQLKAVAPGQAVMLTLPDGGRARAVVRRTAPAMDPQSRLALVYADVTPGGARSGMYAQGEIAVGAAPALAVPAKCVVVRDGRSFVMTIEPGLRPPTVRRRPVTVGRRQGDQVEIVEGLTGGERLVLDGAGFLDDGDVVRVILGGGR